MKFQFLNGAIGCHYKVDIAIPELNFNSLMVRLDGM